MTRHRLASVTDAEHGVMRRTDPGSAGWASVALIVMVPSVSTWAVALVSIPGLRVRTVHRRRAGARRVTAEDTIVREVKEETGLEVSGRGHVLGEREHPATKRHMIYLSARARDRLRSR